MTEADLLLTLIEEANYNYDNIKKVVQTKIDEAQKQINELKAMSQEQFLAMISKSIFGVAMKEYYIGNLEKQIKRLKDIPEHIDNLLEYWRDSKFIFNESIKFYKPYVRQLKQAFQKLGESRFNSKLSSFSVWVKTLTELIVEEVEEIWTQLAEHFADRFDFPDAINRATTIFSKYYLNIGEETDAVVE